jgi:hypothetical protein
MALREQIKVEPVPIRFRISPTYPLTATIVLLVWAEKAHSLTELLVDLDEAFTSSDRTSLAW